MSLLTDIYQKLECLCRKADDYEDRLDLLEAGGGSVTVDGEAATIDAETLTIDNL